MVEGKAAHSLEMQAHHSMKVEPGERFVLEAPRRTAVVADVDVLVVGGGPAGVGAALAAAREGARTLLVERHGMLGGVWTAGLLNPLFDAEGKGWIVEEIVRELRAAGAWRRWKWTWTFDTEAMKLLLERLATTAGAELLYHTLFVDTIVEDGRVRGAIIESKSGREAILAKVVIDCSGEGDVAARGGAPFKIGRERDGLCQPMTLMFEIAGLDDDFEQANTESLYDRMVEASRERGLDVRLPFERVNYAPWIINVPRAGAAAVQATHVYRMNGTSAREVTAATLEGRRQAHELVKVLRCIPGFEQVRLVQTAAAIGVREARRIMGHHVLGLEDLRQGRSFEDAVTFGGFCVDIHDLSSEGDDQSMHHTPIKPYEIPYRCLLPQNLNGILVAGRCISGTHEAHASYRVTGTCMAMGQAAGLAAAMAAAQGALPGELDGPALKRELLSRGAGMLGSSGRPAAAQS